MVWNQYVDEANAPIEEFYNGCVPMDDGDEDEYEPPYIMDLPEWIEWYSRDLMNMWFSLKEYRESSGISNFVMPFATYSSFCEFCYRSSDGMRNSYPS